MITVRMVNPAIFWRKQIADRLRFMMQEEESQKFLLELANTKMPFGKYEGRYLIDLPEAYVLWFKQKGFPKGKLGLMLESVMEIKANGLESLVRPLRKRHF